MRQFHDKDDSGAAARWFPLVLAAHGVVLIVIVALMAYYPAVSEWISAAAQAEFVTPDIAPNPTQLAQPVDEMRIVRSN